MFLYPIYNHNWRNINTIYIYIYNKTSIKRNILTIKQNTSGSRSGYGLINTPVHSHTVRTSEFTASFGILKFSDYKNKQTPFANGPFK